MGKTKKTLEIEKALLSDWNMGIFNCPEVMIGDEGIVDVLRYQKENNSRGELWTCFEIKVSVADFNSKQKKTFIGNLNYYAMPAELYLKVQDKIPDGIGIITFPSGQYLKRAKYQELKVDKMLLFYSMMRSMNRVNKEFLMKKYYNIDKNDKKINKLDEEIKSLKRDLEHVDKCQKYVLNGEFLEFLAKIELCKKIEQEKDNSNNWKLKHRCVYFPKNGLTYKCNVDDYLISKNKKQLFVTAIDVYNNTTLLKDDDKKNALNNLPSIEMIFNLSDKDQNKYFFSLYECSGYIIIDGINKK